MQILFSPAKKQLYGSWDNIKFNTPTFCQEVNKLVKLFKTISAKELIEIMAISPNLAELNYNRWQEFDLNNWGEDNTGPALLSFRGDAYRSLDAASLSLNELKWANENVYVISGLYGLLRPLDAIQYYRLEMKTRLPNFSSETLYKFWGKKLSNHLNKSPVINLASGEYFKAIKNVDAISIDFKEQHRDGLRTIGVKAKRARGLMLRFIIKSQIHDCEEIKQFSEGYAFEKNLSNENNWVFVASS